MTSKCTGPCVVRCYEGDDIYRSDGEDTTYLLQKTASTTSGDRTCPPYIPARYVLAFMSFTGFISIFTLRMDLNIAILSITGKDNGSRSYDNITMIKPGYSWSEEKQDMALSAFYYGYCCTQIIGGYLCGIFGAKRIMGYSVLVTSLIALATPIAIMEGYYLLVLCRVLQGMAQGLAQPCMHTVWSKWAPKDEKTKLLTFSFSGCQLGNIVATLATGYMCEATPNLKWSLVFYVFGSVGVLWSVSWLLLVHETPRQHPRISKEELDYIEQTTSQMLEKTKVKPPWCKMVLNPAFLAIVSAQFANDWGYFALSTCLPLYMQHVLRYEIKQNGFLSSLPFIVLLFVNPVAGFLADWLIARGIFSTKNCRKVMNSVGLLIPAILMVGVCFVGMDRYLNISLITLALGFTGFTIAGYTVNHLDIMPPFAGLLYSMSNTMGTTTGFIGPAIVSVLTSKHNTMAQWRIFFFMTAAIFFVGGIVFLVLAEGEPQSWIRPYLQKVITQESRHPHCTDNTIQQENDNEEMLLPGDDGRRSVNGCENEATNYGSVVSRREKNLNGV